jgi:hypothetical protein
MNSLRLYKLSILTALIATSLLFAGSARANVYATSIKLNNTQTGVVNTTQGTAVSISYILNDNASSGVIITISSNSTPVRTISIASGPGTTKGSNSVSWDGKNTGGQNVPAGTYSVAVTAAHAGYSDWTQITDDTAANNYIFRPRGIAVNKNINSPYYGRIFVGNTGAGPGAGTGAWGDQVGIYKLNADGTPSTDGSGSYGTANYNFSDANHNDGFDDPINLKVYEDDRVYWNNWVNIGEFVAADMLLSTNQIVMPEGGYSANFNYPNMNLHHFAVTDVNTTNARIYLADQNFPSSGIWYWPMTNGIADTNNYPSGIQALQIGGDVGLRCDGVEVSGTNLWTSQNRANAGDFNPRAFLFTNWDGTTPVFDHAAWIVGASDDTFRNLYDFSLDSTANPHYLAVSMSSLTSGGIRILNAFDGTTVVSNLSVASTYHSCNWDNVGNLYGGSQSAARWRAFSPPGPNQATTPALATLQIAAGVTAPHITNINYNNGVVTINFTGASSDLPTSFTLQNSSTVNGTYANAAAVATGSSGSFTFTTAAVGSTQFYRISR